MKITDFGFAKVVEDRTFFSSPQWIGVSYEAYKTHFTALATTTPSTRFTSHIHHMLVSCLYPHASLTTLQERSIFRNGHQFELSHVAVGRNRT